MVVEYSYRGMQFRDPSSTAHTTVSEYKYDALGRRVAKIIDPNGANVKVEYVYDGNQIIEERDGSNNVIASYVNGPGIDEPIAMNRGANTYYYHQDDLGNVVALTDGNDGLTEGDVVERYDYGAFGAPNIYEADGTTPRTASIAENPYLFTGREWNPELNAYWYRTRYYDPTAGRFLSRDTIGLWGDPANLGNPYTYVNNNPWSSTDPLGQQGPSGFLGFDANGGALKQPSPSEMVDAAKEFHQVLVETPLHSLDPNPGPITAAIESDIFFVDRSNEIDLVESGNNAMYTGTQLILTVVPVSWISKAKCFLRIGKTVESASAAMAVTKIPNVKKLLPAKASTFDYGEICGIIRLEKKGRVSFEGMEVRAVRDLSHLDDSTLRAMQQRGFAATDKQGQPLHLHHLNQEFIGPLVEIPASQHRIANRIQHPKGNQAGGGLTMAERAGHDEWRVRYWQARANEELIRRRIK